MQMKYFFYITILYLIVASCGQKQQNSNVKNTTSERNDSILITYICGDIDSNKAISCKKLAAIQEEHPKNDYSLPFPPQLIDTFIIDKTVINKVINLLDNREKAPDFSEDARMYVTIKIENGINDYLCIDCISNQAKYNGESCYLDKELFFLLRYYSGFYLWFDEAKLIKLFNELQHESFFQKVLEQRKLKLIQIKT